MHPECLKLAALHSDAVDYPKSGQPVPLTKIPKLPFRIKPDWKAPETINGDNAGAYYPSKTAIGRLFRSIDLPALKIAQRAGREQRHHIQDADRDVQVADILDQFYQEPPYGTGSVEEVVEDRVSEFMRTDENDDDTIIEMWELYNSYTAQLRVLCADHTLSHLRSSMLTEEEAVVSRGRP